MEIACQPLTIQTRNEKSRVIFWGGPLIMIQGFLLAHAAVSREHFCDDVSILRAENFIMLRIDLDQQSTFHYDYVNWY